MNLAIKLTIFATILFSHLMAARPFYLQVRDSKMPNTVDFAVISVILYYDLGIIVEALEFSDKDNNYFTPFFSAQESIVIQAFIILVIAPWLFRLGSTIIIRGKKQNLEESLASIIGWKRRIFYLATITISFVLAIHGIVQISQNQSVWSGRSEITEALGPLIIILYLPTYFLGFYIKTSEAKTKFGLAFSLLLVVSSILSTFAIGQRNTVLVPILILVLFRGKINLQKILLFVTITLIIAAALLPIFKWQYANQNYSIGELVVETIHSDFSRSNVLVTALERTEPLGTKILPYPMAGYVYGFLYYVPRPIVPFKGWSTAQYLTSDIVRTPIEDTSWGFGVGAIEELLLNIGFGLCIPGLIVYGMCMGALDKLSSRVPSLGVPTRLAGIWLCGYDLPSLLITFGTMAILSCVFHHLFVHKLMYVSKIAEPSRPLYRKD